MDNSAIYNSLLPLTSYGDSSVISGAPGAAATNFMQNQLPVSTQYGLTAPTPTQLQVSPQMQALAKMLMQQGTAQTPTQSSGGVAIKQEPMQDISKLASSIAGMYINHLAGANS